MAKPTSIAYSVAASVLVLSWLVVALPTAPVAAAVLVVATTNDAVNGDTSNPDALIANPGSDGISLREALAAANNAPGPHVITFAQTLAGATIAPASPLPPISRDHITLTGLTTSDGQPNITIDASQATGTGPTVWVGASSFTMTGMRFVFVPHDHAVQIGGALVGIFASSPRVANIDIRRNAFTHATGTTDGFAICIRHTGITAAGLTNNATISRVVIADNTFDQLFEAIGVAAGGNNNLIEDVVIYRNTFSRVTLRQDGSPIELGGSDGSNNTIRRIRILHNMFTDNLKGVDLNNNAGVQARTTSGNVVEDTLIARNVFSGNNSDIQFEAGVGNAVNNTIANTRILNNLFVHTGSSAIGIAIQDNDAGATNNRVTDVAIVNNTIAGAGGSGVGVASSSGGVSGVTISNTILGNGGLLGITSDQVHFSITNAPGIAGINGNMNADPLFVNPAGGDFHLQPGSPAIGAGTHTGAPFGDLECKVRANPPAIGAYEPGNNPSCTTIVPVASVLPASRSVQAGNVATAFAVIINTGTTTATACGLVPATSLPAAFTFRTTNPTTNQVTGTPDTPVNIAPGGLQTYVFGLTPSAPFGPADVALQFTCANAIDAPVIVGLDTLLYSASATPVPDIVALAATLNNDGIVNIPGPTGTGVFAVATVNVGASGTITGSVDTGAATLPVTVALCQTDPAGGNCLSAIGPSVTTTINASATPTFGIFVTGAGTVAFDPAATRIFVRFKDAGGVTRGSTSVAVRTQ